jgi:hypothetical protein
LAGIILAGTHSEGTNFDSAYFGGDFLAGNVPSTRKISYVVVRVVSGVGAESVVEVAENFLGQKRVLSLEGVGSRVEEDLDEVGLDHSAPENIGKMNA